MPTKILRIMTRVSTNKRTSSQYHHHHHHRRKPPTPAAKSKGKTAMNTAAASNSGKRYRHVTHEYSAPAGANHSKRQKNIMEANRPVYYVRRSTTSSTPPQKSNKFKNSSKYSPNNDRTVVASDQPPRRTMQISPHMMQRIERHLKRADDDSTAAADVEDSWKVCPKAPWNTSSFLMRDYRERLEEETMNQSHHHVSVVVSSNDDGSINSNTMDDDDAGDCQHDDSELVPIYQVGTPSLQQIDTLGTFEDNYYSSPLTASSPAATAY